MRAQKNYLAILIWLLFCPFLMSQNIQWASEVISFSSEYGNKDYSANQVLGVPNSMTAGNDGRFAWVPRKEESNTGEYIKVKFQRPMRVQQVAIAQNRNPGAIAKITLYDTRGKRYVVYENNNPRSSYRPIKMFRKTISKTNYLVEALKVELKTKKVAGSNQIDAIAISDSRAEIKNKVDVIEYSEEVGQAEFLGMSVNSQFAERLPIISPDGQTLYFARKYHPKNIGEDDQDDIWVAYRMPDGSWSQAVNVGAPLNNRTHNFVIALNPSGDILYLANDYRSNKKDGVSIARKEGRSWGRPKALKIKNHYNDNEFVSYHVNLDGDVLLMAVERKEGLGDRDLYVSFKTGRDEWSEPKSLGPTINTVGMESSVFIAADGKTIYFSSNGHQGYGGLDMFMTRRLDDSWTNWTTPKNLGPQINSKNNDYNYTIPASGEYAYFSSDNSNGMSDLYRIKLPEEVRPEPVMLVTGRIINAETNRPVHAKLKYQELEGRKNDKVVNPVDNGVYQLVLPYGKDIAVHAELDGYFSVSESMELRGQDLEEIDYDGDPLLAQTDRTFAYESNNVELKRLQLRLSDLSEDLKDLEDERREVKADYSKRRQRKPSRQSTISDPELDALKHKYETARRQKKETDLLSVNEDEKEEYAETSSDPELDALKNKFNKHHNNDTPTNTRVRKPKKKKRSIMDPDEDDELAAMKARYRKHYNKEEPVSPLNPAPQTPEEGVASDSPDFDDIQFAVRKDLEKELIKPMTLQLQKELIKEVKKEMVRDLDPESRRKFRTDLEDKIEEDIKAKKLAELREAFRNEQREDVRKELRGELMEEIAEELRRTMADDIRRELETELRASLKKEIRAEMEYQLKREIEEEVRQELAIKLRQEMGNSNAANSSITNPAPSSTAPKEKQKYQELKKDIVVVPIKVGQVIPMNNLFFDANKSKLKPSSDTELKRVLQFLRKNKNLIVEVGGHTNGWCSSEFASKLSRERAKEVADYFIEQGISSNKIRHRGYGKVQPIASNETLAGRKKNQRVELKILEILK